MRIYDQLFCWRGTRKNFPRYKFRKEGRKWRLKEPGEASDDKGIHVRILKKDRQTERKRERTQKKERNFTVRRVSKKEKE